MADDPTEHDSHFEPTEQSPGARTDAAARTTWVSVGVNVLLAAAQMVMGAVSHSQGLIADGVHSLSDLVADFVVLFAGRASQKDPDADHPYGHQRFETAASLLLGGVLLGVGVGMLWASIHKLEDPDSVQRVHAVALWVAALSLVAKETLFRYMLRVAKRVKSSMLVANAWHARSDAASSLVVGLGIVGNLAGYPILDPIAALIVAATSVPSQVSTPFSMSMSNTEAPSIVRLQASSATLTFSGILIGSFPMRDMAFSSGLLHGLRTGPLARGPRPGA